MENNVFDILIIGGGMAGLSAAISAAKKNTKVGLINLNKGASKEILAFNIPLDYEDSWETFFNDMIEGGENINNEKLVKIIAKKSIDLIDKLEKLGIRFSKKDGKYLLRKVSGGSYPRAVYKKDITGKLIINNMEKYANKLGVDIISNTRVLKIEKNNDTFTAYCINKKDKRIFSSKSVILCTGGIGNLYSFTTYPSDIWGDGYSMAYELGAKLLDMEFVQFEPTIAVFPDNIKGIVMPTALFGDGGILINKFGERFLYEKEGKSENEYHKDKMALAIAKEISEERGTENKAVYFDTSKIDYDTLKGYPTLLSRLKKEGVDLLKNKRVEVAPAAHSHMGGVLIDEYCQTTVEGLFAAGEVSGGIHGANRLAGNSGTETLVMGEIAGDSAVEYVSKKQMTKNKFMKIPDNIYETINKENTKHDYILMIQEIMEQHAGLIRNMDLIKQGLESLQNKKQLLNINENFYGRINHLFNVSEMILRSALERTESRGYHYLTDYPNRNDNKWQKNVYLFKQNDSMRIEVE